MHINLLTQIIGFFALIFTVIGFVSKQRKQILIFQSIGFGLFSIHFYLLGALAGAVMNVISVLRNFVFEKKNTKKWANSKLWFYFFIVLIISLGLFLLKGKGYLLPVFGLLFGTYAAWQNEERKIRMFMLIAVVMWIIYTFLIKSYFGLANQVILFSSLLFSIYKFDIKRKGEN